MKKETTIRAIKLVSVPEQIQVVKFSGIETTDGPFVHVDAHKEISDWFESNTITNFVTVTTRYLNHGFKFSVWHRDDALLIDPVQPCPATVLKSDDSLSYDVPGPAFLTALDDAGNTRDFTDEEIEEIFDNLIITNLGPALALPARI